MIGRFFHTPGTKKFNIRKFTDIKKFLRTTRFIFRGKTNYFRIFIRTGGGSVNITVGQNQTSNVLGSGVRATFKRWSTA